MELSTALRSALADIQAYSRIVLQRPLRPYQTEAAAAIVASVLGGRGLQFIVEMSRQAGKNELSAIIESYLLTLFQRAGGQIVKASPTFKPQTLNSIQRLTDRMGSPFHIGRIKKRSGYIVELGTARALFFSADKNASVVGATASLLLEGDEAQDIRPTKWDKEFSPMTASTNATQVFWGTAWTNVTLLAMMRAACQRAQNRDGTRRVFMYDCNQVSKYVPAYELHVQEKIARLGRNHPLVKSQYFLEDLDAQGGLFSEANKALMRGTHQRMRAPEPGKQYALLIDVAGEDEEAAGSSRDLDRAELGNQKRDATAVHAIEVVTRQGELPLYLKRDSYLFLGIKHTELYERLNGLISHWGARWVVVDATGIGAGVTSFLSARWKDRVIPFEFSQATKSDLGWEFLGIINTGRFMDFADDASCETLQFWYEVDHCEKQIHDGPAHRLSWGVWETPAYDGLIARGHDDLLVAAAFVAVLDKQPQPTTYFDAQVQAAPAPLIARRREGRY